MRTLVLLLAALLVPVFAHAALININTADQAALETLTGIGPSKAAAIIVYRNQNGPFAKIEDIQNVSGIGPTTFENIRLFITVGEVSTSVSANQNQNTSENASAEVAVKASDGGKEPPLSLYGRIEAGSDRSVIMNVETTYVARVYEPGGAERPRANVTWSFGDGTTARGQRATHAYRAPGEYLIVACVTNKNKEEVCDAFTASVSPAQVRIVSVSEMGVTLTNEDSRIADLSGWLIQSGEHSFKIPKNTRILEKKTITLTPEATGFPVLARAQLSFPHGAIAAVWPPPAPPLPAKPIAHTSALSEVQARGEASGAVKNANHEVVEEVAPAAAKELAAAGAALSDEEFQWASVWKWGLGGLTALAAGAFIFF